MQAADVFAGPGVGRQGRLIFDGCDRQQRSAHGPPENPGQEAGRQNNGEQEPGGRFQPVPLHGFFVAAVFLGFPPARGFAFG